MACEKTKLFGFSKKERLSGRKNITSLFSKGEGRVIYPFRVVVRKVENQEEKVAILISVAKKRFHHAVDRNRIKRLIRETYRCNKSLLFEAMREKDYSLQIAFVYVGDKVENFHFIQERMIKTLQVIGSEQQ